MAQYEAAETNDHFGSRDKDEKVFINWRDINFQTIVKDPKRSTFLSTAYTTKKILNGLSGSAESGQLLAILGPTGCGKTSLLNCLAARIPTGTQHQSSLTGTIYVNGKERNEEKFRQISAYVLQDDNMYAHLTVFETLMLSAHFFLPSSLGDDAKARIVNSVISELGLIKAKDTIIGDDKIRGVSGGERKRASIAVQLLCDPAVLFLDEPTTGLDAFQSQAVMESIRNLASKGRLVMTVIHQPRSSIYEMFDKLLVLSEGRTMYYGEAKHAVSYFATMNYFCPEAFNPSDFFLDLLSPDNRSDDSEVETRERIKAIGDNWENRVRDQMKKQISIHADLSTQDEIFKSVKAIGTDGGFKKTMRNLQLLCWRSWSVQSRNVPVVVGKFVISIFFALIIGGIYSNIGYSQLSIQNRRGVLFFVMLNQCFNSALGVMNSFPSEKNIVNRERSGRAYNTFSYFCAKVFVELPLNLLPVLIYSIIVHALVKLQNMGEFVGVLLLTNFVAVALGMAISAMAPNVEVANAAGPPFIVIGILFGGFYIAVDSLPIVANWIPYMSMFQWGFQSLIINEFKGLKFTCDVNSAQACIKTGEEVILDLGFEGHTINYSIFGQGMLLIAFLFSAFVILEFSKMTFVPLNTIGRKFKRFATIDSNVGNTVTAAGAVGNGNGNGNASPASSNAAVDGGSVASVSIASNSSKLVVNGSVVNGDGYEMVSIGEPGELGVEEGYGNGQSSDGVVLELSM